jgi:hypothetical protein
VGSESVSPPPPQIAAAPSRATVDISRGRAGGSIRVFNLGEESISITTSVKNWTMDSSNNIEVISPTSHSLDQSIIINPINFTIAPGKQQVVRYSIRPRSKPGEHRAMVFFNQVTDGPDEGTIDINFRMGVAIYGVSGDVQRVGSLHNLSVSPHGQKVTALADIESTGNANVRLDGQISVWPESSFPDPASIAHMDLSGESTQLPDNLVSASTLSALPVLPGTRRTIPTTADMPSHPGSYVIHIAGTLGDQRINKSIPLQIN